MLSERHTYEQVTEAIDRHRATIATHRAVLAGLPLDPRFDRYRQMSANVVATTERGLEGLLAIQASAARSQPT